jgi:tetratricopeptide (TPR) repeat protein
MKSKLVIYLLFFISVIFYSNTIFSNEKLEAFKESIKAEEAGNYDSAIKPLETLYKNISDDYLINLRLGWLYYLKTDYELSVKYYNKAVTISDKSIESLLGLTYPLSGQSKWDEIQNVYKDILDIDDNNYSANLNLGKIYYNSASYLNAKIQFEKIYENYPSDVETNIYLGWTYYQLGNSSKAEKYFIDALINDPDNSSAAEGLKLTK